MKRKHKLIILIVVVGCFLVWLFRLQIKERKQSLVAPRTIENSSSAPRSVHSRSNRTPDGLPKTPEEFVKMQEREAKSRAENVERGKDEWRTPIEFYGKVVDENSQPVPSVKIHFSCNDISAEGTSDYYAESGADGLFSLKGVKGKLLVLHLTKDSYYVSKTDNTSFEYGDRYAHFVPDPNNPVVFHLRKKGKGEPLLVNDKDFQVSISSKPKGINLSELRAVPVEEADLIVKFVREPEIRSKNTFDWQIEIAVPNGGILISTNEFDFIAPESGYNSVFKVEIKSAEGQWQGRMQNKFFLKLPNERYARIFFDFMPHNGSLRIQSFLNPSGSRNLEYDEAVQSKTKAFE